MSADGEILFKDKSYSPDENEIKQIFDLKQDTVELSLDQKSIINIKTLRYDDQQLEGPTAITKGYLITTLPISTFQEKIPNLVSISLLEKTDRQNKIKLTLNNKTNSQIPIGSIFIVLLIFMFLAVAAGIVLVQKQIILPLVEMTDIIVNHTIGPKISKFENEISTLNEAMLAYINQIKNDNELLIEKTQSAALGELTAQVSHDIRSPLSALNMIASNLNEVSEGKRILIRNATQRINDIANNLLSQSRLAKAKALSFESIERQPIFSPQLASVLIEAIISEKRAQLHKMNIEFIVDQNTFEDSFIKLDPMLFKRILSNLINNSIEAIGERTGLIKIQTSTHNSHVLVQVQDNGCGIASDIIQKIGKKGFSLGKESSSSGNGIGVHHAKFELEKVEGNLTIASKIDEGTIVSLKIPKAETPAWFTPAISLENKRTIVILDDDNSIHDIWNQRFLNTLYKNELIHFKTSEQLENYLTSQSFLIARSNHLFLTDFELLGERKSGLDVIEKYNIADLSILVTSRHEDNDILKRCLLINLKIIPKSIAPFISIKF